METFFTKYLFLFFLIPFAVIIPAFVFATESANAANLRMPDYEASPGFFWGSALANGLFFWSTALVSLVTYLVIFLIGKTTVFKWSALHFSVYIIAFALLLVDAESILILPFTIAGSVFFILNLFRKSNPCRHKI